MSDPYEVLGIDPACGDAEIRRRYLELVRQFPPDQHPERFAAVREAYEQLRDPVLRLKAKLFPLTPHHTIDAILAEVEGRLRGARIPMKTLLSLAE
jgi:DnaJ-domain-containing protein 1